VAKLNVLIVSRSRSSADKLSQQLAGCPEFNLRTQVISNGHVDPLHGVNDMPDLLLLHSGAGHTELQYLADNSHKKAVPLIVYGASDDPDAMRLAMRAGARDYLPETVSPRDLIASLIRLQEETRITDSSGGQLVVVVNGKGGSGGSFIATNLAHSLVVDAQQRVTLVDTDLQFGGLSRYLDLAPKIGIIEALEAAADMDEVSADAYTCEHDSGLRLLAAPSDRLMLPNEVSVDQLDALLNMFLSINDYVVVDSPNRLDAVTEYIFERADKLIVIVQQSLPHVQDTARLLKLLSTEISIPAKRIGVVVNRFTKNAPIELGDIKKALRRERLITIPNQYKLAAESIDSGVPVAEISKNAALTKGIRGLQSQLRDTGEKNPSNFLQRALPSILRR
jgi:pilus assembly protein CpaE